ncbi:MAG TPA: DUF885 domain-containing protein, partial [Candidatus Eremiobacteraceae bacterium]|nr:DUF885 domain-containing protein [Candidatus Eremiobacteraceae bacterium]
PSLAGEAVYSILARDFAPLSERMPSVVARLRKIPAMLAAGTKNLQRSPKVWTEIAIEETGGVIDFFHTTVAPLLKEATQEVSALNAAIFSLREYERFLKEQHALRDGMSFAVGRDFFDYKLKHEHFLPYTAQTLLEFGEQAVRSTEMRLQEVADLIEPNANWADLIDRLRSGALPQSELLDQYRQGVHRTRQFVVERGLVSVPTGETLKVVDTPAFLRPTIPYAAYMAPGAFEQEQQGLYYVTPIAQGASVQERREQLLGHNTFGMLLTNVHEGYPGHHLQLVVANRAPSLVRRLHDSTVFCEGWALYCEQLVLDEGLDSDPRMRLFQLKDQLWRACRIVIDAKLHTGEMSFDEAVDMLVNVAKLERVNAVGEVRRYTQTPTQPMSYLVGKHQILDLRQRERQRLGSRFDLRDFHDRLLAQGSLPVALIEASFASDQGD